MFHLGIMTVECVDVGVAERIRNDLDPHLSGPRRSNLTQHRRYISNHTLTLKL